LGATRAARWVERGDVTGQLSLFAGVNRRCQSRQNQANVDIIVPNAICKVF